MKQLLLIVVFAMIGFAAKAQVIYFKNGTNCTLRVTPICMDETNCIALSTGAPYVDYLPGVLAPYPTHPGCGFGLTPGYQVQYLPCAHNSSSAYFPVNGLWSNPNCTQGLVGGCPDCPNGDIYTRIELQIDNNVLIAAPHP